MGKGLSHKQRLKGVSDLVVILTLIAISIPIAMAMQNWLSAQSSRMSSYVTTPEIQGIMISKSSTASGTVFIIKLKNTGDRTYYINSSQVNASVVLKDGSIVSASFNPVGKSEIKPSESVTASVVVDGVGWSDVRTIVLSIPGENGAIITVNINVE